MPKSIVLFFSETSQSWARFEVVRPVEQDRYEIRSLTTDGETLEVPQNSIRMRPLPSSQKSTSTMNYDRVYYAPCKDLEYADMGFVS